jgi:hypothetical protein
MSIQFVAGKLEGEERKAILQAVQKQLQEAVLFWLDLDQRVLFLQEGVVRELIRTTSL